MYKIEYDKQVLKSIEKIPKKDKIAILDKIEALSFKPRPDGAVTMKGKYNGYHRIRIGNYRVVYNIHDKLLIILVLKIGQRGSIYMD